MLSRNLGNEDFYAKITIVAQKTTPPKQTTNTAPHDSQNESSLPTPTLFLKVILVRLKYNKCWKITIKIYFQPSPWKNYLILVLPSSHFFCRWWSDKNETCEFWDQIHVLYIDILPSRMHLVVIITISNHYHPLVVIITISNHYHPLVVITVH